jgi:hypothetical protein
MKKTISLLLFLCLICRAGALYAQKVDMPMNRLEELLCRKWTASYALMGDMRIDPKPGARQIDFEFKNDKTLLMTSNPQGKTAKGTWNYDSEKKVISLIINGIRNSQIISLKDDELVMLVDTKKATPDDPEPIKMVYKIKEK